MIRKTDTVRFIVSSRDGEKLVRSVFSSFSAAAGHASALDGITRMIDVSAASPCGQSSWSACMFIYSSEDNTRRVANEYAIRQVLSLNENVEK